jgi:hypothetical protein
MTAGHLNLKIYNGDYYTLDAIFYDEKDVHNFPEHTTYAKYIVIALEHENRLCGTQVEINKLQLFNAPLKVLITYSNDEKEKERYLEMFKNVIKDADVFGDISTSRKQLVVFGSCDGTTTNWSFHVYRGGAFVRIC